MGRDGQRRYRRMEPLEVSIHAPAWGATSGLLHRSASRCCFNPRARMGRAPQIRVTRQPCCQFQSTRPHGARRPTFVGKTGEELFQSTRPHGARLARVSWGRQSRRFQSTRPHGARPCPSARSGARFRFNPRARMGRDGRMVVSEEAKSWFQSTRPHGARRLSLDLYSRLNDVSIHAPAWGATLVVARPVVAMAFQSTRPHGARRWIGSSSTRADDRFNPRARMGRDSACRWRIR